MLLKHLLKLSVIDLMTTWSHRFMRAKLRGQGIFLDPQAILILNNRNYHLGKDVSIGAFSYVTVDNDPFDSAYDGGLFVGKGVYIGQWNNIRAAGGIIRIGDYTMISQMVSIIAAGHQTSRSQPISVQPSDRERVGVTIGKDVWLGVGCTVLPGIEIGDGAIIAAGAVVRENVPSFAIYGGVPARQIGTRDQKPT